MPKSWQSAGEFSLTVAAEAENADQLATARAIEIIVLFIIRFFGY